MTPAQNAPDLAPAAAACDDSTLLDASRWAVWQTLARGFAHSLANASQLLMLDPPPPPLLDEVRARITRAHALLAATGRGGTAAAFLPAVLADFDALQQLQTGLPAAGIATDVEDPLPMSAMSEADVLHVLLLVGTRLKESCGADRLEIAVSARAARGTLRVTMESVAALPAAAGDVRVARAPLLEAAAALLAGAGGWLRESDAGWEIGLPVLRG